MKRGLISVIFVFAVSLLACAQTVRHEVKLGNFTRLSVLDNINVNYSCNADSAGFAVFSCTQEVADHLIFSVSNKGQLNIQVADEYERLGNLPTITVYSSELSEAENSGESTLRVVGLPPMKTFKVRLTDNGKVIVRNVRASQLELQILSGKGKIIADGSCDDLSLRLIGTGEIQADQVTAVNVSCRIMGTGSMGCHVNGGELKVSGSGTGKVYYKGVPSKVTVRKLGTIKAIPME
ncbi:MAG: DUF2807 domain-containing protein [Muribaculaceae bacterium]|nr:DUF2807 domain-containing protein [Muribaculaceae bacterium]